MSTIYCAYISYYNVQHNTIYTPLLHSQFLHRCCPRNYSHPYFAGSIHHPLLIQSTRYALRFILLIHFKIQSTTRPAFFPPLLRIPQVMLIISTPRNMKISLPHSPSDFLLPHILCSPYIVAPSPAVILSVSSSRRYWIHISYTPWYRLSLLLKLEVPLPQPSSP